MHIDLQIVNAFTLDGSGGNPAGVVLDADGLDKAQKQQVAKVAGLSETAFVSASEIADFKLEFFTPNRQIAHCGHATVAAFALLHELGRINDVETSKETVDGRREIRLHDGRAYMEQRAPRYEPVADEELLSEILPSLGLGRDALHEAARAEFVNTGNGFLVIPLRHREQLAAIVPDHALIETVSERHDLVGFYPFVASDVSRFHAEARMFAPRYGIPEEAATGMAAGPLAAYLHDRLPRILDGSKRVRITQGGLMDPPSPSEILVDLVTASGAVTGLMAGGAATVREKRSIAL